MFLANLLNMRNGADSEEDKPLLEHLEDLRAMIVRILITLMIGVGVCFCFRNTLMEVMRKPIDGVWALQLNSSLSGLPEKIDAKLWERAAKAANEGALLSPEQRDHLYQTLAEGEPEFQFHVESITYYRSALAVKGKKEQRAYIEGIPDISDEMREQLLSMAEKYQKSGGLAPDPAADSRRRLVFMQSLHPTEGFMLSFKLALYAGIALTFPFLLYFILQFVLPGLHKKERKVLFPALFIGFGLFLGGGFFAYSMVLPRALEFFSTFSGGMGISNDWRIGDYISFTTQFVLIFGLAFELPVLVMALVVLDFLSYSSMAKSRSYAIVGILILAAVVTPTPDAMTLGLLAVPMYLLYELCIILSWFIERKRKKQEEEEEKERMDQLVEEVKREEIAQKARQDELPLLAASPGLIQHEEEGYHEDHEDHEFIEEFEEFECELEKEERLQREVAELPSIEDLEGGGEALDPEAEAREAGGADEDEESQTKE